VGEGGIRGVSVGLVLASGGVAMDSRDVVVVMGLALFLMECRPLF